MDDVSAIETNYKVSFDLNESLIEDIVLENGCSEIISEHDLVKDLLVVDNIGSSEKESFASSII